MLRLAGVDNHRIEAITDSVYFRIAGGAIWTRTEHDFEPILFDGNGWLYRGKRFRGLGIEGGCRIVFGISTAPYEVSEILESVSLVGPMFCVNGTPFAIYDPITETWQDVAKAATWQAFRIESATLRDIESLDRGVLAKEIVCRTCSITADPMNDCSALASGE